MGRNKTSQDAFERVATARTGSLVNSHVDYVKALRTYLLQWADDLKQEVAKREFLPLKDGEDRAE